MAADTEVHLTGRKMTPTVINPGALGSAEFKSTNGIKYAYLAGAMYKGIASKDMVVALARARFLGYFGTGGLDLVQIEAAIRGIQSELRNGEPYGMNLLCGGEKPELEDQTVELFLRYGVSSVEAAAYIQITSSVVWYRLKGLACDGQGNVRVRNRILAKVSRPEVALLFLQPAPEKIVRQLVLSGRLTAAEGELANRIPMADAICVEADSGGHTDRGVAYALMPAMLALRAEVMASRRYVTPVHIGAAGGIGTPEAAAAAFIMGADFVLTGSINQCTVEAGTSEAVKDLLQEMNVQDTAYAPAGDMFEMGAKVQVLKKSLLFPARANKLYELYQRHRRLEDIDDQTRHHIEDRYFRRSFAQVWAETRRHYVATQPHKLAEIEANPRLKMAAVFKWYFMHTTQLALRGNDEYRSDYQVHCGPALGAFNQWVKGTELQAWRNRHVAAVAERIMQGAADVLNDRLHMFHSSSAAIDQMANCVAATGAA